MAALDLTQTLRESDELEEALQLGVEKLSTVRRAFGDEDKRTLDAMMNVHVLAWTHSAMDAPPSRCTYICRRYMYMYPDATQTVQRKRF